MYNVLTSLYLILMIYFCWNKQEYEICLRSIKIKSVFTKTEMNNKYIFFFKKNPLGIQYTYSSEFSIG